MSDLVVIGGGEHARVVVDAARPTWTIRGYIDATRSARLEDQGVPWLGADADAVAAGALIGAALIVAIGDAAVRRRLVLQYSSKAGREWGSVIHPRAVISRAAEVGHGVVVMAGAVVNIGARLDDHCIINTGAIIEHDVAVGVFAHVGPGAAIGGGATIGDAAWIGLGARVRDHIRIGAGATVGMGAAAVADVADGAVVVGVPARPHG